MRLVRPVGAASVAFSVLTSACGFSGSLTSDAQASGDGKPQGPDARAIDAPVGCINRPLGYVPKLVAEVTVPKSCDAYRDFAGNVTIDTDSRTISFDAAEEQLRFGLDTTKSPQLVVIAGDNLTITGRVRVIGSRPLVIVDYGTLTVRGELDVSANRSNASPGGRPCPGATANTGDGGGAGGTFGTKGGNGGSSSRSGGSNNDGTGGTAANASLPNLNNLVGGCNGSPTQGNNSSATSLGGTGGGAVALIGNTVTITSEATILANGGGGRGGNLLLGVFAQNCSGGAGGGSGGMIYVLGNQATSVAGKLFAHGGQGGNGGANAIDGFNGQNGGTDCTPPTTLHAIGGRGACGSNAAMPGGSGGVSTVVTADFTAAGGGGGAGIIAIGAASSAPVVTGSISPNPTPIPN